MVSDAVTGEDISPPFTAHWCVVEPGKTSKGHMHREEEAFFIARGRGVVTAGDSVSEVEEGDTVFFEPFVTHTIHNPAGSTENLVFISVYWAGSRRGFPRDTKVRQDAPRKTSVLALATPPTPNGGLHLGHLAGPYLAADIWTRYMRARGASTWLVTGTDDHQTYVAHKACQLGKPVEQTATRFGREIRRALESADVRVDEFIQPAHSNDHREWTAALFRRLYELGKLRSEETPSLYCEGCQRHLFEVYVRGRCPHCEAPTGGNGCEKCGQPNECVDLIDPICNLCGTEPAVQSLDRIVLPLDDYRGRLRQFVERAQMGTHVRILCERMLAKPLPTVSVTHVSDWGVPVPVPGFDGQVIWSWLEIGAAYLKVAGDVGVSLGLEVAGSRFPEARHLRIVQFFGFDNAYFKTILLPALFLAADEEGDLPDTFVTNEFYRLEGRKFSTSADHVVSVLDVMDDVPSDQARYYLARTRPELEQTNFTSGEYAATIQGDLVDGWQGWLHDLGRRVHNRFGGVAPDTGLWTECQRLFETRVEELCADIEACLDVETFSTRRLTRRLCELVDEARSFGATEAHWSVLPEGRDLERTAVALELAAARALAITCSPIMPRFASRLWNDLGCSPTLAEHGWRDLVAYMPPGTRVTLNHDYFPLRAAGPSCGPR